MGFSVGFDWSQLPVVKHCSVLHTEASAHENSTTRRAATLEARTDLRFNFLGAEVSFICTAVEKRARSGPSRPAARSCLLPGSSWEAAGRSGRLCSCASCLRGRMMDLDLELCLWSGAVAAPLGEPFVSTAHTGRRVTPECATDTGMTDCANTAPQVPQSDTDDVSAGAPERRTLAAYPLPAESTAQT